MEKDSPLESTVILEPSGDCAYFLDPATGPGVYYYGSYAINEDKLDISFYSSEVEENFPETKISFAMSSDSLVYSDETTMGLFTGMVLERREEAPDGVQSRAPVYTQALGTEGGTQGFDHGGNGAAGQPEADPAVHTLTEAEIAALWQKMDGVWLIADDTGLTNQGVIFERFYDGTFGFLRGIIATDATISYYINEVTEQNGVYQLMTYEVRIGGSRVEEYEQDVREVITLILWEEDHAIEVSTSVPEQYGHNFIYESGEFQVDGVHYRSVTAEEAELLRSSPDGRVELANGDFLEEGYVSEPILCYYAGTVEDAHAYLYGY